MWSIKRRHFQWPWTTPNLVFKVTPLFDTEYLTNGYKYGHSYYRRRIGNRTQAFEWYHFQCHWVTSNLDFKVMITVWTVVQTVLTATSIPIGNRQISTLHKINTPEPIDKKICTIDYIREGTSYTKFGRNPFTGGFWANGWNIRKIISFIYLYPFSLISLQVRPVDGFLRALAQKTWNHARMCVLGFIKLKFNFKPLFIPKTVKFWPKTGQVFFDRKCLTMGALKSKLPLIIIVAP